MNTLFFLAYAAIFVPYGDNLYRFKRYFWMKELENGRLADRRG